ncbi:DUF6452 family protein [Flavobacterium procerum]|uniref:DUF6452 family protein n=1 Tax=Flavobacterium procerum TaxID=1455569 RepID=A0ABV6BQU0_9FLAO
MKKIIAVLLLFTFGLSSCEKDDICDANTQTTPRLVITFYYDNNPTTVRNVSNMKVVGVIDGVDQPEGIIFNENGTSTTKYLTSASTVSVPLRVDADTVTYKFIYNASSSTQSNTDLLTINYSRTNAYVSRACGYKTTFQLPDENDVVYSTGTDGEWMKNIEVKIRNIETENETHVEIFF